MRVISLPGVYLQVGLFFCSISILRAQVPHQPTQNASHYLDQGQRFFEENAFDSARSNYERAFRLFISAGENVEGIQALTKAAESLLKTRNAEGAIQLLKSHVAIADKLPKNHEAKEGFYDTFSKAYYYAGDAFSSLTCHQVVYAININRKNTPDEKMLSLIRIMGVLNGNAGQLQKAIEYYTKYGALVAKMHGEKHLLMSDAYNYLGIIYRNMGEYDMALDYYKKSISIAEQYTAEERRAVAPRFTSVAPVYNNIGTVYHDLRDDQNALNYTLRALELHLADKSVNPSGLGAIYSGLGTTYSRLKQYENAIRHKYKAKELFITAYGEKHGRIATELRNIADTYFEMKDYETAESFYKQALAMNLEVHKVYHPNTSETYANIGDIYEVQGNLDNALQQLQLAIQSLVPDFKSASIYDNPDINSLCPVKRHLVEKLAKKGDLLSKLSAVKEERKNLEEAHRTYGLAVSLSEVLRNDLVDGRSKLYLAENTKTLYEKSLAVTLKLHRLTGRQEYLDAAFSIMEKNKSRLLLESIQHSQMKNALDLPDSLFNHENGLKSRIAYYEELILDEQARGKEKDSIKIKESQEGLFKTRRALEAFVLTLQRDYPKYHFAKYSSPSLKVNEIQGVLDENDVLLEFFSGDSAMYVFYAGKATYGLRVLDKHVQQQMKEMVQSIRAKDFLAYTTLAQRLYQEIIVPVLDEIAPLKPEKFIIIPDGIVSYVPFELLLSAPPVESDYQRLSYAIKNFHFNYHLSSSLLLHNFSGDELKSSPHFVGFAPRFEGAVVAQRGLPGNIPYAQQEVKQIAISLPGEIFLGPDATESNFRSKAGQSGVIHLATHASIDEINSNFSRLYFAAADTLHDGLLHAYELFNLRMNAELITLSACNTALGQYKEGEGVMSLSRAFAYAGCNSIVTSLWPAQDQTTAEIMELFYANLADGMSKDDALRNAKLSFLETSDKIKSDPFYWASFILIGDTAPLEKESNISMVVLGALLALSLFGLLIYWQRKRTIKIS